MDEQKRIERYHTVYKDIICQEFDCQVGVTVYVKETINEQKIRRDYNLYLRLWENEREVLTLYDNELREMIFGASNFQKENLLNWLQSVESERIKNPKALTECAQKDLANFINKFIRYFIMKTLYPAKIRNELLEKSFYFTLSRYYYTYVKDSVTQPFREYIRKKYLEDWEAIYYHQKSLFYRCMPLFLMNFDFWTKDTFKNILQNKEDWLNLACAQGFLGKLKEHEEFYNLLLNIDSWLSQRRQRKQVKDDQMRVGDVVDFEQIAF